jgi:hypothetical protein
MNEKITLLAEQAWDATAVSPDFGHPVSFAEKFAELIIRECVNTIDQQYVTISDDADPEDNKTWIGAIMNTTVARCKHSILSNIGVAE